MCNLPMLNLFNAIFPDVGCDLDHANHHDDGYDQLDADVFSLMLCGHTSLARHVTRYDAFDGVLHSTCLVSNTGAKIKSFFVELFLTPAPFMTPISMLRVSDQDQGAVPGVNSAMHDVHSCPSGQKTMCQDISKLLVITQCTLRMSKENVRKNPKQKET